jgi:hypothetical protein
MQVRGENNQILAVINSRVTGKPETTPARQVTSVLPTTRPELKTERARLGSVSASVIAS